MRDMGDPTGIGYTLHGLGSALLDLDDLASAKACVLEGLEIKLRLGDQQGLTLLLEVMARMQMLQCNHERSASLYGYINSLRTAMGYPRTGKEQKRLSAETQVLRDAMGDAEFERCFDAEETRSLDEIVAALLRSSGCIDQAIDNEPWRRRYV